MTPVFFEVVDLFELLQVMETDRLICRLWNDPSVRSWEILHVKGD
jgi:hypothetical protein